MTTKVTALILGGFLPAIIYGGSAILQKMSVNSGISLSAFLIASGVGLTSVGICYFFFDDSYSVSMRSGMYACIFGATWGVATGLVAYTLLNFEVPISQLVPLYNMNTLVAVLLALIVFSEWKDLSVIKLLAGSCLIVVGAIFVANA